VTSLGTARSVWGARHSRVLRKHSLARRAAVTSLGTARSTSARHAACAPLSTFSGALDVADLANNPLVELQKRSQQRGLCDEDGARLPGQPWGMQLAHVSDEPWPAVRTIGFQTVRPEGFTFLLKRRAGLSAARLPVAINYVEGRYMKGDVCEQWRAEGFAEEISVAEVLKTAPAASFAQILAASARTQGDGTDDGARKGLGDRASFISETAALKQRLGAGHVPNDELTRSAIVYLVAPARVELLIGGPDFPMWERIEWRRDLDGGWADPMRILPY